MGPSTIYEQYKDAMSRYRDAAKQTVSGLGSSGDYEKYKALMDNAASEVTNAKISGALSVIGGLEDIAMNTINLAKIQDTPEYDWQINQLGNIGNRNYNTYDDLIQDYSLAKIMPDIDYQQIRGMSTGQKIGNVATSTLSGATTGLQVGGVYGAIAGAAVGLGSGIAGWIIGDEQAKQKEIDLNNQAKAAQRSAQLNLGSSANRLTDYNFRQAVSNIAKDGGKIERKQMSIEEFAKRALSRPKMREHTVNTGIVRERCNGGTMIRFKK